MGFLFSKRFFLSVFFNVNGFSFFEEGFLSVLFF